MLIFELEKEAKSDSQLPFIINEKSIWETFKRAIKHAINEGYIDANIFIESKKTFDKRFTQKIQYALQIAEKIVNDCDSGTLSLKRGDNGEYSTYSKEGTLQYLKFRFGPKPAQTAPPAPTITNSGKQSRNKKSSISQSASKSNQPPKKTDIRFKLDPPKSQITFDNKTIKLVNYLDDQKITQILRELQNPNCNNLPLMAWCASWVLFEILKKKFGYKENSCFADNLGTSVNINKRNLNGKEINRAISDISKIGNSAKHDSSLYRNDTTQLSVHLKTIEPYLQKLLEELINKKSTS